MQLVVNCWTLSRSKHQVGRITRCMILRIRETRIYPHPAEIPPPLTLSDKVNNVYRSCEVFTAVILRITAFWFMKPPIRMTARSKALTVFARWNSAVVGSNPTWGWMSVCVYSVFVLSCVQVAALRRADPPSKESYCLCKDQETEKAAKDQQRAVEP
jgi:hypothetical protein